MDDARGIRVHSVEKKYFRDFGGNHPVKCSAIQLVDLPFGQCEL